jgi:predicted Ser/Thr protein kinase
MLASRTTSHTRDEDRGQRRYGGRTVAGDEHSAFGAYDIQREVGRGGMGVVYLATDRRLGRRVALKVIVPELAADPQFRLRFEREARVAATLEHPHVVPVYEAGEHDGSLFIAMRFIDGRDLATEVRDHGRVAPDRLGRIVSQVAGALDAAHRSGVVHRDVKPANVLLTGAGDDEQAYLTDFGLTREAASESGLTLTGQWVGTVDYAAPEQILGEPTDARSDVYALGCLAFQALTGRPPFQGAPAARLFAHMNEPPPSACAARPDLRPEVDAALSRAMAKKPADRFQSAGDLGRALAAALAGQRQFEPERTVARGPALTGVPPVEPVDADATRRSPVGAGADQDAAPAATPADPHAAPGPPPVDRDATRVARPADPDPTRVAPPPDRDATRVRPPDRETTRVAARSEPAYTAPPETTLVGPAPGAPPGQPPTITRGRQPRVLAGIALVLVVAAAAVITMVASGGEDTSYADRAKEAVADLARANRTLSDRFTGLSAATPSATITSATDGTATAARDAQRRVAALKADDDPALAKGLTRAIDAEQAFLGQASAAAAAPSMADASALQSAAGSMTQAFAAIEGKLDDLPAVEGISGLTGWVQARKAAGQRRQGMDAFIKAVDAVLVGARPGRRQIQQIHDAIGNGTTTPEAAGAGLDQVVANRQTALAGARALSVTQTDEAGTIKNLLVESFERSLDYDRDLQDGVAAFQNGDFERYLAKVFDDAGRSSEAATKAKREFLAAYNKLRASRGLTPVGDDF